MRPIKNQKPKTSKQALLARLKQTRSKTPTPSLKYINDTNQREIEGDDGLTIPDFRTVINN